MKVLTLIFCISILAFVSITAHAGKPTCSDVPVTMTFAAPSSGTAAIWNDDPTTVYSNGVGGIDNEVIHFCSGTHDATIKWEMDRKQHEKSECNSPI